MLGGATLMDDLDPPPRGEPARLVGRDHEVFAAVEKLARSFDPPLNPTIVQMAFEVGQLVRRETSGLSLIEIEAARNERSLAATSLPLIRASHKVLVAAYALLLELAPCEAEIRALLDAIEARSSAGPT